MGAVGADGELDLEEPLVGLYARAYTRWRNSPRSTENSLGRNVSVAAYPLSRFVASIARSENS